MRESERERETKRTLASCLFLDRCKVPERGKGSETFFAADHFDERCIENFLKKEKIIKIKN